jgi:hypothetical protein
VIPLAFLPIALAFVKHDSGVMFFITFGSMCIAAPCVGFWWGERKGQSSEGRAALGCVGTLVLFVGYFMWLLVLAPLILRAVRAA